MSQNIFYDKKKTTTDVYEFKINSHGSLLIRETGTVTIIFENGLFKKASFPFSGIYTRNGWRILAAIEKEIEAIEKEKSEHESHPYKTLYVPDEENIINAEGY